MRVDLPDSAEEVLPVVKNVNKKKESIAGFTNYGFDENANAKEDSAEDVDKSLSSSKSSFKTVSIWHRIALIACCMTPSSITSRSSVQLQYKLSQIRRPSNILTASQNAKITAREQAEDDARSARDDPQWKPWLNVGAALIISIATFIFGFYA